MQFNPLPIIRKLLKAFPGPILAKLTCLWKVVHVLRGTYRDTVARLHERLGPVVQTSPEEISVADKSLLYIPNLTPLADPVDAAAYKDLQSSLHMSNLFSKEHDIDTCNQKLLDLLSIAGKKGENFNLRNLLTRYAFETMIITTTDVAAGFLEPAQNYSKIDAVLADWKFYSVLYGNYLRYHPFITAILKLFRFGDKTNVEVLKNTTAHEARIALALAGADPTITLLFNAIQHVYANPVLVERLRGEIAEFRAAHAPTFKELILNKGHMPLLHAILLECARLQLPYTTGPRYAAGEGFLVGEQPIAPGTKITLEPSITHVNPKIFGDEPFSFKPERWLDSESVLKMKNGLLAFNASTASPIESVQILIVSKFMTLMIPDFDISACPNKNGQYYVVSEKETVVTSNETAADVSTSEDLPTCGSEASSAKVHAASEGNRTPVTLSHADRLISILGNQQAQELLNGRFAPHLTYYNKPALFTQPIDSKRDRALVHEAITEIYGKRLQHFTHPESFNMAIGPYGSIPREYLRKANNPRQQHPQQQHGRYNNNGNKDNQRRPNARQTSPPQQPRPDRPTHSGWGSWANTEEQRQLHFKTAEGYREKREAIAKQEQENPVPARAPVKYTTIFKQTNGETVNGKLGGARKTCATEIYDTDGNCTRTEHMPLSGKVEKTESEPKTGPKPGFVPPHLRKQKALEEGQKQAQEQVPQ